MYLNNKEYGTLYIYSLLYIIYHISLFSKDAIDETFKGHPLHRKFHCLPLFFVLSEVVSCIHTLRQTKVCYFNHKIDVNPAKNFDLDLVIKLMFHRKNAKLMKSRLYYGIGDIVKMGHIPRDF